MTVPLNKPASERCRLASVCVTFYWTPGSKIAKRCMFQSNLTHEHIFFEKKKYTLCNEIPCHSVN